MVCVPADNDVVVNVATLPEETPVPIFLAPSKKLMTVPSAIGPRWLHVTVAVNVTACPAFDGFNDDVTVVLVGAGLLRRTEASLPQLKHSTAATRSAWPSPLRSAMAITVGPPRAS